MRVFIVFLLLFLQPIGFAVQAMNYETTVREFRYELRPGDQVIPAAQIQGKTLSEVFRQMSLIQAPQQGSDGQLSSLFLNGAKSEHTLVLLDGVPLNDLTSTAGAFDLSSLDSQVIDEIVIRKGPQAVRYGGSALAGVIEIFTKKFSKLNSEIQLKVDSDMGQRIAVLNGTENVLAQIAATQTPGMSSASKERGHAERDAAGKSTGLIKWQKEDFSLQYFHSDRWNDYDLGTTPPMDDLNARSNQRMDKLQAGDKYLWSSVRARWRFAAYQSERNELNAADSPTDSFSSENYQDRSRWLELLVDSSKDSDQDPFSPLLGLSYRHTDWRQNSESTFGIEKNEKLSFQSAVFAELPFKKETWSLIPGLRRDCDEFLCADHQEIQLGKSLPGGVLFYKYSDANRSPSLYQRYSIYGDRSLRVEEAQSHRLGLRGNAFTFEVMDTAFKDLIDFNSLTSKYYNIGSVRIQSFEASHSFQWIDSSSSVWLAYLKAIDNSDGRALVRRSPWRGGINYQVPWRSWGLDFAVIYKSASEDVSGANARVQLAEYFVFNAGAKYEISQNLSLHLQAQNLLDEKFEDVFGYGAQRRQFGLLLTQKF